MKLHFRIGLIAAASVALVPFSLSAEEAAKVAAAPPELDAQMVEKGRALYAERCTHCHGFNMVNPGTVAYDLRQFPHDQKSRFVNSVTNGKNGRMPSWGDVLSRDDIDVLWAYVMTGGK